MSEKRLKDEGTLRDLFRGQVRLSRAVGKEAWTPIIEKITVDALVSIVETWAEMNELDVAAGEEPTR